MLKVASLFLFCAFLFASNAQEREIDFIKVNVGGPELYDVGFLADEPYFYSETTVDTTAYEDTSAPVVPTAWGEVYRSHRYAQGGILSYKFPVPDGAFDIGLLFVEQYDGVAKKGGRVFDLYINDVALENDIDVWMRSGKKLFEPYYLEKPNVSSIDGYITISLVPKIENAMLSGIIIAGKNAASILWKTKAPSRHELSKGKPLPVAPIATVSPVSPVKTPTPKTTSKVEAPTVSTGPGVWRNTKYTSGNPVARHEACAVFAEGFVYSIGGRGMKPVSVFDPIKGVWSKKTGPPVEINHMQCVYYKGKVYIGSSWYGKYPYEHEHENMWVYNIKKDSWSTLKGLPEGRRRGGAAFVLYKGKLYLSHGAIGGHGPHATVTAMLDVYDPKTDKWTALPDGPEPRDHTGGTVVNGKLCVAGGRNGASSDFWSANIAPVVCYSFSSKTWEKKANLPTPRGGAMVGTTCSGIVMIAGGEGKTKQNKAGQAFDRVDFYDESRDIFLEPSYMTSRRHGSGLAISPCDCGNIYVPSGSAGLGGGPEVSTTDVWSTDGVKRQC